MGYFTAGTWQFSKKAVELAAGILAAGGSALDAVEKGVNVVESDPEVLSVGVGGYPNMHGECELDAGVMCGKTLATGAVLGIKGFPHPVSVARRLMEETPHTAVAGTGADIFAYEHGFVKQPEFRPKAYERWFDLRDQYKRSGQKYPALDSCMAGRFGVTGNIELDDAAREGDGDNSHDTVGMIAMDQAGNLVAATSTSGLWLKIPGRIGDTPFIGSGFYADNQGGAAVATGVGEEIMRGCMSFLAVTYMTEGMSAQQAAEAAIGKIHRRLAQVRGGDALVGKMAVVCADKNGGMGAAANHAEFYMNYAKDSIQAQLFEAPVIR